MKLVVVSDLHLDAITLGVPRHNEIASALKQAVARAIELRESGEDVAFICLGDVADPDSGGRTTAAQEEVIEVALRLLAADIRNFWIAGNHDVWDDGTGATTLGPLAAFARSDSRITVSEEPGFYGLKEDLDLLTLPYVSLARRYDPAEIATNIFGARTKIVVVGHLMIPGVVPGEETAEMPRGRDVLFPIEETRGAILRVNGHYHRRQTTAEGIVIPGALARLTFGEERHEPGFLVVDVPT